MTPITWKILLHATDGGLITYSLSSATWHGAGRVGHGITVMSTCRPEQLSAVLDAIADEILHTPGDGDEVLF